MIAIIPHIPGIFGFWLAFLAESNAAVVIVDMDMVETWGLGVAVVLDAAAVAIAGPSDDGLGADDDTTAVRVIEGVGAFATVWATVTVAVGRIEADAIDSRARHKSRG